MGLSREDIERLREIFMEKDDLQEALEKHGEAMGAMFMSKIVPRLDSIDKELKRGDKKFESIEKDREAVMEHLHAIDLRCKEEAILRKKVEEPVVDPVETTLVKVIKWAGVIMALGGVIVGGILSMLYLIPKVF